MEPYTVSKYLFSPFAKRTPASDALIATVGPPDWAMMQLFKTVPLLIDYSSLPRICHGNIFFPTELVYFIQKKNTTLINNLFD
jgi:hypothetical protein